jgi:AraC family transcriptional regulator
MKSQLKFIQYETHAPSECGSVLDIEFSASELNWPGIILEKGCSPHFYPNNVYTPYFYFALGLERDLNWSVKLSDDMTDLKTSPGDIWINPPHSPFSHDISEPCYFLILAIEEQDFLESCSLKLPKEDLQFLNNYNVHDETIKGIMELFMLEAKAGGRNGLTYLENLSSLLSTHYIQNYSNYADLLKEKVKSSKFDQSQVDRVDRYISENINRQITVEDLAEVLHCSKFYFLREFKKLVGITPYQYLMNERLERAKKALTSPTSDIASVASDLGFNDQSHFTRSFKNQFGMTPGQYQKQVQ